MSQPPNHPASAHCATRHCGTFGEATPTARPVKCVRRQHFAFIIGVATLSRLCVPNSMKMAMLWSSLVAIVAISVMVPLGTDGSWAGMFSKMYSWVNNAAFGETPLLRTDVSSISYDLDDTFRVEWNGIDSMSRSLRVLAGTGASKRVIFSSVPNEPFLFISRDASTIV